MPMPPLALSTGPAVSGSDSRAGVSNPFSIPFVFDNSGWIIQNRATGNPSASGSTGAASGSPNAGAGTVGGLLGNINPVYLVIGLGVWLMVRG